MKNGWMDWIEWMWMWKVESGKWRGSGSHTIQQGSACLKSFKKLLISKLILIETFTKSSFSSF